MKKILFTVLSVILMTLTTSISVKAADFTTSLSGNTLADANSEISVDIKVSGINSFAGIVGTLNYDSSKLQLLSATGVNGFSATNGTRLIADAVTPINGGSVISLRFRVLPNLGHGQATVISYNNVNGTASDKDVSGTSASITISVKVPASGNNNLSNLTVNGQTIGGFNTNQTYYKLGTVNDDSINIGATSEDNKSYITGVGTKRLNFGKNIFNVNVQAENGSIKKYTIEVTKKDTRNNNNNLGSLIITNQKIDFNKDNLNYSINVDNKTTSIEIKGTAEAGTSTVSGFQTYELVEGLNTINIIVTAENGTTKTYQISVVRAPGANSILSKDNSLKSLNINGINITLSDKTVYLVTVPYNKEQLDVLATSDPYARITIKKSDKLNIGPNTITITVIAQNGDKKIYTIYVVRKDINLDYIKDMELKNDTFHLNVNESYITNDFIKMLKKLNKAFYLNVLDNENNVIYRSYLKSEQLPDDLKNIINVNKFNDFKLIENGKYITFTLKYSLDTQYQMYVGHTFQNNQNLYVYKYEDGKMKRVKDIKVVNGHIEMEDLKHGNYFITDTIQPLPFEIAWVIVMLETTAIGFMVYYIKLKYNKRIEIVTLEKLRQLNFEQEMKKNKQEMKKANKQTKKTDTKLKNDKKSK